VGGLGGPALVATPRRMADLESLDLSGAFVQRAGSSGHSSRGRGAGAKAKPKAPADDDEDGENRQAQHGLEASIEVVEMENDDKDSLVSAATEVKRAVSTTNGKTAANANANSNSNSNNSSSGSGSGSGHSQYRPKSGSNMKFFDLNDAFSKFWDNETENSVSSLQSPGGGLARFSPNPHRTPSRPGKSTSRSSGGGGGGGVEGYQRSLDERNEALLGLQRQKVMSYTQNAQLEREVELLRKQLEKMEQLEKSFDMAKANRAVFHDSLKQPQPQPHGSKQSSGQQGFQPHWQAASIFPIDEEQAGGFNDTVNIFDRSSNTVIASHIVSHIAAHRIARNRCCVRW
jgi:hypothetical protein